MREPAHLYKTSLKEWIAQWGQKTILERQILAGIPPRYREADLDSLRIGSIYQAIGKDVAEKRQSLFLTGIPGSGKTHMACAIANGLIGLDARILYLKVPKLFQFIRRSFAAGEEETSASEAMILESSFAADLVILDDVGAERVSDFTVSRLFLIVDDRYEGGKQTIITSNLSLAGIASRIHPGIARRIKESYRLVKLPDVEIKGDFGNGHQERR